MTTLTGQQFFNTYGDLLTTTNNGDGLSTTLQRIQDGLGNSSPIQIATTAVNFIRTQDGNDFEFQLDGVALTATATQLNSAAGGDVTGPSSSTPNDIAIFSDNTGKVLSDSGILIKSVTDVSKVRSSVISPHRVGVTSLNLSGMERMTCLDFGEFYITDTSVDPTVDYPAFSTVFAEASSLTSTVFSPEGNPPTSSYATLEVNTTSGALLVSRLSDTQITTLTTTNNGAVDGMILYNTTGSQFNMRQDGGWVAIGTGGGDVTEVNTSTGLTGGPINVNNPTGTISLASFDPSPAGSYENASITVNDQGQVIVAATGSTAVTSVSGTTDNIIVSGAATTPIVNLAPILPTSAGNYTYAAVTVDNYGRVTVASSGTAPVTSVTGTLVDPYYNITVTGTTTPVLNLGTTGVVAGTYTNATFVVDDYGRITTVTGGGTSPVSGPGSSFGNDIAVFNGITGVVIADSGINLNYQSDNTSLYITASENSDATGTYNTGLGVNVFSSSSLSGNYNSSFGYNCLSSLTTGYQNTSAGSGSLIALTDGYNNTAVGFQAGQTYTSHNNCTFIGFNADASVAGLTNSSAIGANAVVSTDNSIVLGDGNCNVGIGVSAPENVLHIVGNYQQKGITSGWTGTDIVKGQIGHHTTAHTSTSGGEDDSILSVSIPEGGVFVKVDIVGISLDGTTVGSYGTGKVASAYSDGTSPTLAGSAILYSESSSTFTADIGFSFYINELENSLVLNLATNFPNPNIYYIITYEYFSVTTSTSLTDVPLGNIFSADGLTNSCALGANATVDTDNSIVLGDGTCNVGIGTSSPENTLHIIGTFQQQGITSGWTGTDIYKGQMGIQTPEHPFTTTKTLFTFPVSVTADTALICNVNLIGIAVFTGGSYGNCIAGVTGIAYSKGTTVTSGGSSVLYNVNTNNFSGFQFEFTVSGENLILTATNAFPFIINWVISYEYFSVTTSTSLSMKTLNPAMISSTDGLTNSSAIGANAVVSQDNSIVLGNGSCNVGIGTSSPENTLHIVGTYQQQGITSGWTGTDIVKGQTGIQTASSTSGTTYTLLTIPFPTTLENALICRVDILGFALDGSGSCMAGVTGSSYSDGSSVTKSTSATIYNVTATDFFDVSFEFAISGSDLVLSVTVGASAAETNWVISYEYFSVTTSTS